MLLVTLSVKVPQVETVGFCAVEVKPEGPIQLKLTFASAEDPKRVALGDAQVTVPVEVAVTPAGNGVTKISAVTVLLHMPPLVPITVYVVNADGVTISFDCVVPDGSHV